MNSDLDYIFKPRSIAVVGASRDPLSFGHRVVDCLVQGGFRGPVYPVNFRAKVIHSFPCYPSLEAVPDPIDLAVIVVPAPRVAKVVEQAARKGVKGVVVISAGFREAGLKGEALEKRLVNIVRKSGMRMVGPNCMGVINTDPKVSMNATFAPASMKRGRIAFMSQSGAMGMAILNYARELGLGFSMYASIGNRADVSANDLLEYWAKDPDCDAILLYIESFGNPRRFTQIARSISPEKPIIAVKAGRTVSGLLAVDLHTGESLGAEADTGSDVTVDAIFQQCGVLRVQTLEELFDLARAIINQPLPQGNGVGVLTNGGGPGIMAADALEGLGLEVPPLDPRTLEKLSGLLPSVVSIRNPMDMRADAEVGMYRRAIPALLEDPNIDVLLVIYVGLDYSGVASAVMDIAPAYKKPLLLCLMGGKSDDPCLKTLAEAGIPVYSFPESACRVIRHLCAYRAFRERPKGKIKRYRSVKREAVEELIHKARREGREELTPEETQIAALAYGAKVPPSRRVHTEEEALAAAEEIGYPVVAKAVSPRLRKKSEVGMVKLDLRNPEDVRKAYRELMDKMSIRFPSASLRGVLIQKMIKGGQELILGGKSDPVYGPVLKLGAGGPYAELIADFQFRIVPITTFEAMEMIKSLKIYPLLEGIRGRSPIHIPSLIDLLCRASQFLEDFEEIREFEINPLIIIPRSKDMWAVDGTMKLFPKEKEKNRMLNP